MRTFKSYPHRYRRKLTRRSEQGQSFLEFALIVPVLFLMLVGVTVLAEGLNLQMVLHGAAYEGARIWAKSPVGGDPTRCSPPACADPDSGSNNFETYVVPVVRQYVSSNGFDGAKVVFFSEDQRAYQNALDVVGNDVRSVRVILLYPYDLPIGNFAVDFGRIMITASCAMKRGG